ncbi:MAG: hypothetical protein H6Q72_4823 [Firmicutes bacterium]|nr:hypothetical protein [Bacillota bacterium]
MFAIKKQTTPIRFLVILLLSAVIFTGCSRSATPETKSPVASTVGIIDMNKAVKSHPKYAEWQNLKQQAATLRQRLSVNTSLAASPAEPPPSIDMQGSAAAGLQIAAEQEFNAKMAAKQRELQAVLTQKANQIQEELAVKHSAYAQELDEEYRPQIFNYQLKLQTVRMDEQQAAEVKKKLDDLKAEQAEKMAAKEKELNQSLAAMMEPEKAAMQEALAAYASQINAELNSRTAAKTTNIAGQTGQEINVPSPNAVNLQVEQQLGMKQQEIDALEEYMVNDIRDKAGKVAIERNLDTVLTGYQVNVTAVDITNAVIAAFKK